DWSDEPVKVGDGLAVSDLLFVNGTPAFYHFSFLRLAENELGSSWTDREGLSGIPQFDKSTQLVNGLRAFAWRLPSTGLLFTRALDAEETVWPVVPMVALESQDVAIQPTLIVTGGRPALVYTENALGRLKIIRSLD